jgi:signal peptidase
MIKKTIIGILGILFVAVVGFFLLPFIPGVAVMPLTVLTGSMEPTIPTGSVVFVAPAEIYTEGNIITFKRGGLDAPVTHRVTGVEVVSGEYLYTTKGDANEIVDMQKVRADEVLGKVSFHIPYVGWLIDKAKTPIGFTVLIVVPALLVIFDEAKKIWQEVTKKKETAVPVSEQQP